MLKYAKEKFATMTELANLLVREKGLDFSNAHEIIATDINDAIAKRITADKITGNMISNAAKTQIKKDIHITDDQLQTAIDPWKSILRKTGLGMPSPVSVKYLINNGREQITIQKKWITDHSNFLNDHYSQLQELVKNTIK